MAKDSVLDINKWKKRAKTPNASIEYSGEDISQILSVYGESLQDVQLSTGNSQLLVEIVQDKRLKDTGNGSLLLMPRDLQNYEKSKEHGFSHFENVDNKLVSSFHNRLQEFRRFTQDSNVKALGKKSTFHATYSRRPRSTVYP